MRVFSKYEFLGKKTFSDKISKAENYGLNRP